uniref:Peptidase S8/S53 domain-containing protein n=1 Tax=Panagrolaimus sp. ES5 TaxID=591445 RepID=A0AC34F3M2_9BILA
MFCLNFKSFFLNPFSKTPSTCCYIPKDATQQSLFLSKYPEFDGRGIKIAIIDSGCDVSLEGLQKTSEGLPKIMDYFDFTGAGDVDTSVVKEMDSKNVLIGLSGRKLKIPQKWINPSGKWHLGLKALYKPSLNSKKVPEKLPEIDCIVWYDGKKWMACVETYKNDLQKAKILTTFREDHEYGILKLNKLKMAYCITIHGDGNLLEICTPYDDHGSIVARIAAAHFPGKPEQDGLAPGAQILFMSVLDPSKGLNQNMEALKNSILKCIDMKVDIINYSISYFAGDEAIENQIYEMIIQCNILLFKSAGNRGPFYGTVWRGERDVDNVTFTIGSILTPELKRRLYNIPLADNNYADTNNNPSVEYNSVRGPGLMGSRGVDFTAPGTIITNMAPRFYSDLRNLAYRGTSNSSPNAAGAVACLLSALKGNSIQYSPASIKFALFKTANLPNNAKQFEFGHGIIQIDAAFDYCKKNVIPNYSTGSAGILFVWNDENRNFVERSVNLSDFIKTTDDERADAKWMLELSSKNDEKFIKISQTNENKSFAVKVNRSSLEAGTLNYTEIMVIDPLIGTILNIPVFAISLLKVTETRNCYILREAYLKNPYHILFEPFFKSGSKKCEIKITALEKVVKSKVCIQYLVFDENRMPSAEGKNNMKVLEFSPKDRIQTYFLSIKNEIIHDLCIYQVINSSTTKLKFELNFQDSDHNVKNTVE